MTACDNGPGTKLGCITFSWDGNTVTIFDGGTGLPSIPPTSDYNVGVHRWDLGR